jgi:ribosomal protein S18 acetylase RimI-like enzyme
VTPDTGIRAAGATDRGACLALWVRATAVRDDRSIDGVRERAEPKFDDPAAWFVAVGPRERPGVDGFVLCLGPGRNPYDASAPEVGLLAVAPEAQGRGLGERLLAAAVAELRAAGHERALLNVLADNAAAVRLYERSGWSAVGGEYEHPLLRRPTRTYAIALAP